MNHEIKILDECEEKVTFSGDIVIARENHRMFFEELEALVENYSL